MVDTQPTPKSSPNLSTLINNTNAKILKLNQLLGELNNKYKDECSALARYYDDKLSKLGISMNDLPTETRNKLDDLARWCVDLGLVKIDQSLLLKAVFVDTCQQYENEKKSQILRDIELRSHKGCISSRRRQAELLRVNEEMKNLVKIEGQKAREWKSNGKIIQAKIKEYSDRRDALEASLVVDPKLEYQELQSLATNVKSLRNQASEKQRDLDSFSSLPPDLKLAWLKLEESKQTLVI
ncbi:hypothetical protein H4219_001719 [Mycoemilia scoparia]|uniref:Uncharacterized protein n=1 Tax=Mycoemilia scoparia TaxID=417184 RepID=A0A9W8A077_9FUNG|nr:hypothetical protein H4219_001719 [Mycoemilia scoparia]